MNGELADLICLATYGNQFLLRGTKQKAPDLLKSNTTFKYVRSIRFLIPKERRGKIKNESVGESTGEWFQYLKRTKVRRLRLVAIDYGDERPPELPDYIAVAFANCTNWAILAESDEDGRIWVIREETAKDLDKMSQRIWEIEMMAYPVTVSFRAQPGSIEVAEKALRKALNDILRFSEEDDELKDWAGCFSSALTALNSKKTPSFKYFAEMIPKGWIGTKAKRLMVAAELSWVFGGMCSWNDLPHGFDDHPGHKEYLRVTDGLYRAMIDAFIVAANEVPSKDTKRRKG